MLRGRGWWGHTNIRLEEISAHTSHIANVITDVIGDDCGVVGVVLVDTGLYLTDQVSTHVSSLGVNATGNTSEQGNRGGAEAEASETLHRLLGLGDDNGKGGVAEREAQQAKANNGEAHDRTSRERHRQAIVEGALLANALIAGAGRSRLGVAVCGNHHAPPARARRQAGAKHE